MKTTRALLSLYAVLTVLQPAHAMIATCQNISAPSFGTVQCKDVNNLLVCTAFCKHGFEFESLSPIERRICIKDADVWINGNTFHPCRPLVEIEPCQSVSPPRNGVVRCENVNNRIECNAKCKDKYMFENLQADVRCVCDIGTGVWFEGEHFPQCIKNESLCSRPLAPENGMVNCQKNGSNVSCIAVCQPGYIFSTGEKIINHTCNAYDGRWPSGVIRYPRCIKTNASTKCQILVQNRNTNLKCEKTKSELICIASCAEGYTFESHEVVEVRVCDLYDGKWFRNESIPRCIGRCDNYLIRNNAMIKDSDFSASSSLSDRIDFGPERSKLDTTLNNENNQGGGWRPKVDDLSQFIQIKLPNASSIVGITLKGLDGSNVFVTRFRVLYSMDGKYFVPYSDLSVMDKFFNGNNDSSTPVEISFSCPFDAQYIRINPLEWTSHIGLRFDLLGCSVMEAGKTTVQDVLSTEPIQTTPTAFTRPVTQSQQTKCSPILPPVNGIVNCEESDQAELVCSAICKDGFKFDSSEVILKRVCDASTGTWTPENTFPPCLERTAPTVESINHLLDKCIANDLDCRKSPNGDYQTCGNCHYFASCSEGYLYVRPCPVNLMFDSTVQKCLYTSTTCATRKYNFGS